MPAPVVPRYLDSEAELDSRAYEGDTIWAAVVFSELGSAGSELGGGGGGDGGGGGGNWSYTLRFNASNVPSTRRLFDRFATGRSRRFEPYYSSGFLSLQHALNDAILARETGGALRPPSAYGVPFPVPAYQHSVFFDFAGNLIGILAQLTVH